MTNDEREMLRETRDAVIRMEDKVAAYGKSLYGNGERGLVKDMVAMKIFRTVSCWFYGVIGVAGVGLVFKLIYGKLIGG
jgi:hypothetical protein